MIEIPSGWGVVVDLDDTLYSEWDFHDSGFRTIAHYVEGDSVAAELLAQRMLTRAKSGGDAIGPVADAYGASVADLLDLHRYHSPSITLFPDARQFVERTHAKGHALAVVTDGRSRTQRNKVEALGIGRLFTAIVVSEEVGVGKPAPLIFKQAELELGPRPGYVYIGDNPSKDFVTPNGRGWLTVMRVCSDPVHPQRVGSFPRSHWPSVTVNRMTDLEPCSAVRSGRDR